MRSIHHSGFSLRLHIHDGTYDLLKRGWNPGLFAPILRASFSGHIECSPVSTHRPKTPYVKSKFLPCIFWQQNDGMLPVALSVLFTLMSKVRGETCTEHHAQGLILMSQCFTNLKSTIRFSNKFTFLGIVWRRQLVAIPSKFINLWHLYSMAKSIIHDPTCFKSRSKFNLY